MTGGGLGETGRASTRDPAPPVLDVELLRGFEFTCRADCGLCCYASPRISPAEEARLLRIAPSVELRAEGGVRFIASAPEGGACRLLRANRCSAHDVRPAPCREFPVEVHLGARLQATLVLSCPGLDFGRLRRADPPDGGTPLKGLDAELASVRSRVGPATAARLRNAARRRQLWVRRFARQGRWVPEEAVRERLRPHLPLPGRGELELEPPPAAEEGLDRLPLYFDRRAGPVAIAEALGGWELLELSPGGGIAGSLGIYPPPDRAPALSADGRELLEGYLRYWLERDHLFDTILLAMQSSEEGDLLEWTRSELGAVAATTLARAAVRARARGSTEPTLSLDDVDRGIRATDQDLLDRPGLGDRL